MGDVLKVFKNTLSIRSVRCGRKSQSEFRLNLHSLLYRHVLYSRLLLVGNETILIITKNLPVIIGEPVGGVRTYRKLGWRPKTLSSHVLT